MRRALEQRRAGGALMFVRTVLGDIAPESLGVCYAHEHVIIDPGYSTQIYPEFLIDSVENAAAELADFYRAFGRAMIDTMPCGGGRNISKLVEVSRRSGVHIVCPTGLHLQKYYSPDNALLRLDEDALTALFVGEIEQGIDSRDCAGSEIERAPHRAGIIKVAGGREALSDHEKRCFRAAARAHLATGCPIITHTEEGTAALEQIDIFSKAGVDLRHVVLSHTDRKPDVYYHRQLLRTGVNLEYDSAFRWKPFQGNPTFDLLIALLPEFPDQLMLGMDAARRTYWKHYGGAPGLTFLLSDFAPRLQSAGFGEEFIKKVFVDNPARCFQFAPHAV
jgi:predicted metal-dependent phosphotriesterase family hydrolase